MTTPTQPVVEQVDRAAELLPDVMPGHWDTEGGADMARRSLRETREQLSMGHMSDLHLANAQFLEDITGGSVTFQSGIKMQTAAKERIRWLSAHLAHRLQSEAPLRAEIARLEALLNTPETADFLAGVPLEAAHQRERWGSDHDHGKTAFDWFWLIGYLAQKAASSHVAGDMEKALHHTISTAAALANWHMAISGADTRMRPGIDASQALGDPHVEG